MSDAVPSVAHYWRDVDLTSHPFVHPEDCAIFARFARESYLHPRLSASEFIGDPIARGRRFIHFSLLPAPFAGDVKNADIFVLMLNPGFTPDRAGEPGDYAAEEREDFLLALRRTLKQDYTTVADGYHFLNPSFAWHPGYNWLLYERQLRMTIATAARLRGISVAQMQQELSRRLAILEIMACHSEKDPAKSFARRLPSSMMIRRFVQNELVRRRGPESGEVSIFVGRQARAWGFSPDDDDDRFVVCNFNPGLAAGCYMNPTSRGGRLILRRLVGEQLYRDWVRSCG